MPLKKLGLEKETTPPQRPVLEAEIHQIEQALQTLELLWKRGMERHSLIRELSVELQERRRELANLSPKRFWRRFWKS
jgi:hypothetical protein